MGPDGPGHAESVGRNSVRHDVGVLVTNEEDGRSVEGRVNPDASRVTAGRVTDVDVVGVRGELERHGYGGANPKVVDDPGGFGVSAGSGVGGAEGGIVGVRLSPEGVRAKHGAMEERDCGSSGHGLRRCLGRCHT